MWFMLHWKHVGCSKSVQIYSHDRGFISSKMALIIIILTMCQKTKLRQTSTVGSKKKCRAIYHILTVLFVILYGTSRNPIFQLLNPFFQNLTIYQKIITICLVFSILKTQ